MKTTTILVPVLLLAAGVASAQPTLPSERVPEQPMVSAQLRQAATGASFRVGERKYRLAPGSVVTAADGKSGADAQRVRVGKYAVELRGSNARSAKAANANPRMAAAVGGGGEAVIVTSALNVYVTNVSALQDAVRATGGKLTYSSAVGGKGKIEYASVDEAIKAMSTIQGLAGVKEASPVLVPPQNTLF